MIGSSGYTRTWWFILLSPHNFISRSVQDLFCFVTATAKLTIHIARRNTSLDQGSNESVAIFYPDSIFNLTITGLEINYVCSTIYGHQLIEHFAGLISIHFQPIIV